MTLKGGIIVVVLVLCIPLIAMQFSDQVSWDLSDFVVAGSILFIGYLGILFLYKFVKNPIKRLFVISVFILLFVLFFVELAVGVFGSPLNGS